MCGGVCVCVSVCLNLNYIRFLGKLKHRLLRYNGNAAGFNIREENTLKRFDIIIIIIVML